MFVVYLVKALSSLFYVCTYIDRQLNHLCRYSVQITHNLNSTPVSHACDMHVQKQKHVWHQTTQSAFIPICNELKSVIRPYKESATPKTTSVHSTRKVKTLPSQLASVKRVSIHWSGWLDWIIALVIFFFLPILYSVLEIIYIFY